jgi:hypothetical protein
VLTFTRRRLSLRRLAFFPLATVVYLLFRAMVRIGQGLDDLFFRGYRTQPVRSPVFVIAFPRSGTTFLHRLLCLDEEQFTYHKTYQTLLPAVSLYKLVSLFTALDRRVTAFLPKLVRWFNQDLFSGWRGIHPIGLGRAEEDEGVFLYPVYTPVFYMLFPFIDEFRDLEFVDDLPDELRQRITGFYEGCLRRHLYAVRERGGHERTLLVKNVHSTGRVRSILQRFPDARFVFVMRDPREAIPSLLSLYYAAWQMHSPDIPRRSPEARALARMGYAYYRHLQETCETMPSHQYICVGFEELTQDPEETVERIYAHFELSLSPAFRARLRSAIQERANHRSNHRYSLEEYGLREGEVYEELSEVFEFLDQKCRTAREAPGPGPSGCRAGSPARAAASQARKGKPQVSERPSSRPAVTGE